MTAPPPWPTPPSAYPEPGPVPEPGTFPASPAFPASSSLPAPAAFPAPPAFPAPDGLPAANGLPPVAAVESPARPAPRGDRVPSPAPAPPAWYPSPSYVRPAGGRGLDAAFAVVVALVIGVVCIGLATVSVVAFGIGARPAASAAPAEPVALPGAQSPVPPSAHALPPSAGRFGLGETASLSDGVGGRGAFTVGAIDVAANEIVVTVTIVGTKGVLEYNRYDWSFLDGAGEPRYLDRSDPVPPQLGAGRLRVGERVTGKITFAGAGVSVFRGAQVRYSAGFDVVTAYWVVP